VILNYCVWGKGVARVKVLLAVTLLAGGALTLSLLSPKPTMGNFAQAPAPGSPVLQHANPQQARDAYGKLPMAFEPNVGQTDARVKFMARGSKYGLFLTNHEAVLSLVHASSPLQMSLAGSNPNAEVAGTDALPGKSNYLIGKDSSQWHTDVPQFARVRYSQVYPGVDLVYYGKQGELEYDFQVAPGADPKQVALQFAGADNLHLDGNGDLLLAANGGEMRLHAPVVYQRLAGEKKAVEGKFVLLAKQQVGFELGAYDRSRELVIDPVLSYSTYLGGSGAEAAPVVITADNALNAYVAGSTSSANFPMQTVSATVPSSYQSCLNDPSQPQPASPCNVGTTTDAFIAKLNPTGTAVIFATYLGGSGDDSASGIAIDSGLNVVIAGTTNSNDFPVASAFQPSRGTSASPHVFVSKVDPDGHALLYSTYLRGSGSEMAAGVAVDLHSKIYVIGTTNSADFPVTPDAFQVTPKATQQVFVSKIDPATSAANSLLYSTYFGGGDPTDGNVTAGGIAVDASTPIGVYITGSTTFKHTGGNPALDFPILNAPQSCLNDPGNHSPCSAPGTNSDAFVAKLTPTAPIGSHLVYSTYFGGSGNDFGRAIAVDTNGGFAYITGQTSSADIPLPGASSTTTTTIVPFQQCIGAGTATNPVSPTPCATTGTDAFVAKFNAFSGGTTTAPTETVTYFSYLGGTGIDEGDAIAADANGGAYITGVTSSGNFPVLHAPTGHTTPAGGKDAFVSRIDTTATTQTANTHFSFYLGGSGDESGTGIAVDTTGGIYVAGSTPSGNFPTTAGVLQTTLSGSSDAFVTKLGPAIALSMTAAVSPTTAISVGGQATFTYTITNNGDFVPGATVVVNLPDATKATVVSVSGTGCPATATPPSITCTLGPIATTTTTTTSPQITVILAPHSQEPPSSGSLSSSAVMIAPVSLSASKSIAVNDYILSLAPNSATVKAGSAATYNAQVSPTGSGFPGSVAISCTGLPTGASCSVANGSITNLNTGPQSRAVVVNTTVRTTTTVELRKHGLVYAVWFPVSGLAFLGLGVGGTLSRKRRAALGLLIGTFFVLVFLQAGCGSSNSGTTTTTGTPAGTYTFTVTASSGTGASHSQIAQITVQ
jgi:hypothetical protein